MRRAILSLLICSTAGCGIVGPDEVKLRLTGTVTLQNTVQPVAGALVQLFPTCYTVFCNWPAVIKTTTDAQGHYSITQSVAKPCKGSGGNGFLLSTSASGFVATGKKVECIESRQEINFPLAPTSGP